MNWKQKTALVLIPPITIFIVVCLRHWINHASRLIGTACVSFYSGTDVVKVSALLIAFAALIIAWNNYRRGNTAIIKIKEIRSSDGKRSWGLNSERPYGEFRVYFNNIGIPLHNAGVNIEGFSHGHLSIPLQQFMFDEPIMQKVGTLEKGMTAHFGLRTFELEQTPRNMLLAFGEPTATNIRLVVHSNGFLVASFRVGGPQTFFRRKWNHLAWKINEWFTTRKMHDGQEYNHPHSVIPTVLDMQSELQVFLTALARQSGPDNHAAS
jgi:hypothetical protein